MFPPPKLTLGCEKTDKERILEENYIRRRKEEVYPDERQNEKIGGYGNDDEVGSGSDS